jgi:dihydrofolate reductase
MPPDASCKEGTARTRIVRPFNIIVSCSENRVIGRAGRLPWRIPEDLEFFFGRTAGQVVVLGRICFESWPGATRDGRRAVVVTSGAVGAPARAAGSLRDALEAASALPGELFVCGGQRIFEEAVTLPEASRLRLTLVHAQVEGDRFFPEWRTAFPRETARREGAAGGWRYTFLTLER